MEWVGKRFGRLTVTEVLPARMARCLCDCGTQTVVHRSNLGRPNTTSCGCLRREMREVGMHRTHGLFPLYPSEYRIWALMKNRCTNPRADKYDYYGRRGITVAPEWRKDFAQFLSDMGPRPSPAYSLDRIDNDGPYSKGNCRWATRVEQARNRRPPGSHAAFLAANSKAGSA